MSDLIKQRIKASGAKSVEQELNVLREIIQEIALLGLWRSKFFENAAFYGGTALRILYGLDRFSEYLDFTLKEKDKDFNIEKYGAAIVKELSSYDFEASFEKKQKSTISPIESAFIKADTQISFLVASSKYKPQKGSLIKVKIEVDTDAIEGFETEAKQFFWPQAFAVLTCDKPSLMAGKLHATFCRGQRNNVKGRDWYDFLWYTGQGISPNWLYLEAKMRDSKHWTGVFSPLEFCSWAKEQVMSLDIKAAKRDVERFIPEPSRLDGWSKDLFIAAIDRLIN